MVYLENCSRQTYENQRDLPVNKKKKIIMNKKIIKYITYNSNVVKGITNFYNKQSHC